MGTLRQVPFVSSNWNVGHLMSCSYFLQQVAQRDLLVGMECGEEVFIVVIGNVAQLRQSPSGLLGQGEPLNAIVP